MSPTKSRYATAIAVAITTAVLASQNASAVDTWNNGGIGDGTTWDNAALNWNAGTTAFTNGDAVVFDNTGIANNSITVPASITAASITATQTGATAAAQTYTIAIASGQTLNVTGNVAIGQTAVATPTTIKLTNGGNFNQTGGNLTLSLVNALGNPGPAGNLDASGLTIFTYNNSAGEVQVGVGFRALGNLTLANTGASVNSITASAIRVGDSVSSNASSTPSIITLGGGLNTLDANTFTIGNGKGAGSIVSTAGSTINIASATGGNANITIGRQSSASGTSNASQLLLAGSNATVSAGTVIVGQLNNATGGTATGVVTFDTGNFTVATSLQLATDTNGADASGTKGTVTVGTSAASTGILDVSGAFIIGNVATGSNAIVKTDTASFIMNGGTTNSHVDITSTNGKSATTTLTTTLSLLGGTLNMNGFQIGSSAVANNQHITTVNMPITGQTATLSNLGGTGINDNGVNMATAGTLILAGTDTYSNNTNISNGILDLDGSYTGTGTFVVTGTGTLGGKGSTTGLVTVANGAFIGPGDSINTLGVGSATLAGTLNIELNDADANIVDVLNDAGTLDLTAGTSAVNFIVTGTPSAAAYVFAKYGSLAGTFGTSNIPAGYAIDYNYQGNNQIALVASTGAVPEPASITLLGLGAAAMLKRRRHA